MITFAQIVAKTLSKPETLLIFGICISLAFVLLALIKKRDLSIVKKIAMLYASVIFIAAPFFYLTYDVGCTAQVLDYQYCSTDKFFLAIPYIFFGVMISIIIFAITLLPLLLKRKKTGAAIRDLSRLNKLCQKIGMKTPSFYFTDQSASAFSIGGIRPAIFFSLSFWEAINSKEKDAVLLHELAHLRRNSGFLKLNISLLRIIAPQSFSDSISVEELACDEFAINVQKTSKYIQSAKEKMALLSGIKNC